MRSNTLSTLRLYRVKKTLTLLWCFCLWTRDLAEWIIRDSMRLKLAQRGMAQHPRSNLDLSRTHEFSVPPRSTGVI